MRRGLNQGVSAAETESRRAAAWQRRQKVLWLAAWTLLLAPAVLMLMALAWYGQPARLRTSSGDELLDKLLRLAVKDHGLDFRTGRNTPFAISARAWDKLAREYPDDLRLKQLQLNAEVIEGEYARDDFPQPDDVAASLRYCDSDPALLWAYALRQRSNWSQAIREERGIKAPQRSAPADEVYSYYSQSNDGLEQRHGAQWLAIMRALDRSMPDDALPYYYRSQLLALRGENSAALAELRAGNAMPRCSFPCGYPLSQFYALVAAGRPADDKILGSIYSRLSAGNHSSNVVAVTRAAKLLGNELQLKRDARGFADLQVSLCRMARAEGIDANGCDGLLGCIDGLQQQSAALWPQSALGMNAQQNQRSAAILQQANAMFRHGAGIGFPFQNRGWRDWLLLPAQGMLYEQRLCESGYEDELKFRQAIQPGSVLHQAILELEAGYVKLAAESSKESGQFN